MTPLAGCRANGGRESGMNKAERRALMIGVVENQLRDNNPPETRQTLERLMASWIDKHEALRLIACVVATEIFGVLKEQRPYDRESYVERLTAPALGE
jgi:hypothetical protein